MTKRKRQDQPKLLMRVLDKDDERPLFKFSSSDALTLDQIAQLLHITRERVRQIEAKALAKLKRELSRRGYTPEDLYGQMEYPSEIEGVSRPRARNTNE